MFRIGFLMERFIPTTLNGTLDAGYLGNLTQVRRIDLTTLIKLY